MSAGFIIFSAGDIRQCLPHTRFMCHAAKTEEISGSTTDIKMESTELDWISNTFAKILSKNTRMPLDFGKVFFVLQEMFSYECRGSQRIRFS